MTREEWLEKWKARGVNPKAVIYDHEVLADALELAGVFEPRPRIEGMLFVAGDDINRGDTVWISVDDGSVLARPDLASVSVYGNIKYRARNSVRRGETVVVELIES